MTTVVIDNHSDQVIRLLDLLGEAYPDSNLRPDIDQGEDSTFSDWNKVRAYLKKIVDSEVIVFLDLSLDGKKEDFNDALRGLDASQTIRAERLPWVLIAFTRWGQRVKPEPRFREAFDGIIDKADLDRSQTRKERLALLKNAVDLACRQRAIGTGASILPNDVQIVDSLGMRLFRAAFGDRALAEILRNEAGTWTNTSVRSVTSGHSGAFMLAVAGQCRGPRKLVVKVARTDQIIQDEILAPSKHLSQLESLNGSLATFDSEKRVLSGDMGVYYLQAQVQGKTLLENLATGDSKSRMTALKPVVDLCIDVCETWLTDPREETSARALFKLTPIDIGRFETSAIFLAELGRTVSGEGLWPREYPPVSRMIKETERLARDWAEDDITNVMLKTVVQHGDLNPGNVMIRLRGNPVLIDFQRLGPWTIGYDLGRLSLMLRLRLLDHRGSRDWMPQALKHWIVLHGAAVADSNRHARDCEEAAYCDRAFAKFLKSVEEPDRCLLMYGYKLGTLWDLIKIVSYQDLSPYKRLWAFVECWGIHRQLKTDLKSFLLSSSRKKTGSA